MVIRAHERKHENMHLVLKRRTTRPPRSNMRTQQRAFRDFQAEFNHTRPHEALDGAVPADLYSPSPRPFPKTLKPITYPGHFETRLVSSNGGIRWYARRIPVSRLHAGHDVGLEQVDHGLFDVYFGPIWLGRFVEPKYRIFDSLGRGKRRTGGTYKGRRTPRSLDLTLPRSFTGRTAYPDGHTSTRNHHAPLDSMAFQLMVSGTFIRSGTQTSTASSSAPVNPRGATPITS